MLWFKAWLDRKNTCVSYLQALSYPMTRKTECEPRNKTGCITVVMVRG